MIGLLWPLATLKLVTPAVTLRQPGEDELWALAGLAGDGVHRPGERPFLTPWTDGTPVDRARHVVKQHWSRKGAWAPGRWELELGVFAGDRPCGMVVLEAADFDVLREVKTESWLGLRHQGKGYGVAARTALLPLAFDELGAVAALTEVFQDNTASQGVSRKLGYVPDGISRDNLDGEPVISDRLRLTRETWARSEHAQVTVEGLSDECRAMLGV